MASDPPPLVSWYQMLESVRKLSISLIWLLVLVVIAAAVGKYLIFSNPPPPNSPIAAVVKPILPPTVWREIDQHLIDAVVQTRQETEKFAQGAVDQWVNKLMQRVDNDFLKWYFNYWNQQLLGLNGLYHGCALAEFIPTYRTGKNDRESARGICNPRAASRNCTVGN